jgi:hypothetical protein
MSTETTTTTPKSKKAADPKHVEVARKLLKTDGKTLAFASREMRRQGVSRSDIQRAVSEVLGREVRYQQIRGYVTGKVPKGEAPLPADA